MSDSLWETHAKWWIDGFTDGADPEYEEQILPLAARELDGRQRVLDRVSLHIHEDQFTGIVGPIANGAHAGGLVVGMVIGLMPNWMRRLGLLP